MNIFSILGIIIYLLIVIDVIQTTLSMQGAGWLTSRFSHIFWKGFLNLSGKNGSSKILSHAGYILLIFIVLIWVVSLWSSMVLMLYSNPGAIIESSTKMAAGFWQVVYYSGFTLSTLGMGDFIPAGDVWRILTSIYSFTGLILLTMSVTYFIPVLSAVIEQQKLGISLSTLGSTPQEIVLNSWNKKDFKRLIDKIDDISDSIIKYSQQHRAYPVIHYFHNPKQKNNVVLQLARLYEAMIIITDKIKKENQPAAEDIQPLIIAFENYFETISEVTHISLVKETPPAVSIQILKKRSMVLEDSANIIVADSIKEKRRFFKTLVAQDGWEWDEVDKKSS
ncbi:potassium channel family protein [Gramella sp. AN32]|uniref:Potassium channel family protein n=1 Tax=Christiangramia antarctica TaxID=2058158 RepID=A0ABW5X2P6_9FLAO|nr:potassium channel family protein [Gramella sp. AN32]MCM4156618.1 two pore domain potassium channel family protein [Gramella sp. AN32]